MRKTMRIAALCLAAQAVAATPALADVISVDFTAKVKYGQGMPVYGVSASFGDLVQGHFEYDTLATDVNSIVNLGFYRTGTASFSLGGHTISLDTAPYFVVADNFGGPNDQLQVQGGTSLFGASGPTMLVDGVATGGYFVIDFTQPAGPLASDALPTLAVFDAMKSFGSGAFYDDTDPNFLRLISFDIDRVDSRTIAVDVSPVPEPSTWAMLGIGLLTLLGKSRRRA